MCIKHKVRKYNFLFIEPAAHIMHIKIVYTAIPFKYVHVGLYFKNTKAYQVILIPVCAYYAY